MNRLARFDYARAFAILCVVISHTSLQYVFKPHEICIDSLIHNFVGVGVPLFLFMAGYFVKIKPKQNLAAFMKNKITRIYIPTIIWTVLFGIVFSVMGTTHDFNPLQLLGNMLFLSDPFFYYFTFVIMILFVAGFYIYPVSEKRLRQIVRVSFAVSLSTIVVYELAFYLIPKGVTFPAVAMYRNPFEWLFFFVYGIYTSRTNTNLLGGWFGRLAAHKKSGLGLAALLLFISSLETLALYDRALPGSQDYFKVASFFFEIIAIHYLFIFLQNFHPGPILDRSLTTLAKYSFFIYLVHMPTVEKLLGTNRLMALSNVHYLAILIEAALCLAIPLGVVLVMHFLERLPQMTRVEHYIGILNN